MDSSVAVGRARLALAAFAFVVNACSAEVSFPDFPDGEGFGPESSQPAHEAAPLGNARIQVQSSPVARTIATDPDHDTIWVVGSQTAEEASTVQGIVVPNGSEPGDIQIVQTLAGPSFAYVSLHNAGAIAVIPLPDAMSDTLSYTMLSVCRSPRGMDVYPMASRQMLFVACADGALVGIDTATNTVVSTLPLEDDLKDVVVIDGVDALVTRFRSAEVLVVNLQSGAFLTAPLSSLNSADFDGGHVDMAPEVAWQMIPVGTSIPRAGVVIAHQLASTDLIVVPAADAGDLFDAGDAFDSDAGVEDGSGGCSGTQEGYGPSTCITQESSVQDIDAGPLAPAGNPANGCGSGVVAAAATLVTLPVDDQAPVISPLIIVAPMVPPLAIAAAQDPGGPTGDDVLMLAGLGNRTVGVFALSNASNGPGTYSCVSSQPSGMPGLAALAPTQLPGIPVAEFGIQQGDEPALVAQFSDLGSTVTTQQDLNWSPLSDEDGRNLFHQATPSLMSCASCHPNGRDDGHIWNFDPMGLRRTPALGGGLLSTAPFHWDGSEPDIAHLMTDVFVGRMEAPPPTAAQVSDLSDWLNALPEATASSAPNPTAVAAGQALFQSAAVGCTTCHTGPHFTNNLTLDVGTGGAFQVPSLLGVGSRPPYLHDGRALTLEDRFDPTLGGGDLHGHTSQLSPTDIENLVAYLRSL